MKVSTILSFSALFMASIASAAAPDLANKIDTCVKPGVVALTFDDGPGIYTEQLLTILDKHKVKATFFVLGIAMASNATFPAVLKKVYDQGHQVASHTFNHNPLDQMTVDVMKKEITDNSNAIFNAIGVRPLYMRAPQGACEALCTKTMEEMNQVVSHWNVDSFDWKNRDLPDPVGLSMTQFNDFIVKNGNVATDSFITLQHDIHQFSVEKLTDQVITAVKAKGFRFVTMEECIGKPAYEGVAMKPTGTDGAKPTSPSDNKGATPTGGASMTQVGAWAMGIVALASTLVL
ncbi:chitin deacetylase [Actinomortierella ambigua]|uniref:Chitin deacetylase n=1 Tax=Actinomortierella ambigua TaxID=1343610 RepID=A0A9P6UCJ0_9FUNG|nr:chitin deacetylase [Actinomortierella ambigua]